MLNSILFFNFHLRQLFGTFVNPLNGEENLFLTEMRY